MLPPSPAASTRSGSRPARAPKTASTMRKPVTPRIDDAAGMTPLTIVPGGAITRSGRNRPAVFGTSSRSTERTHNATTDSVKDFVALMAPGTCGAEPVKSAVSVSPATSSVTWIFTGGPPTPLLSR